MDTQNLLSVGDKLADFDARCEAIMALLDGKRQLPREERMRVEILYRTLKDDLKRSATVGTVSGEKTGLTETEEFFYAPAVRAAALALAPAVNSNPITSDWYSALYNAQIELKYQMPRLNDA